MDWTARPMSIRLTREVRFDIPTQLGAQESLDFLRSPSLALQEVGFLTDVRVHPDKRVTAELPVNAAFFGKRTVRFNSQVENLPNGARLVSLPSMDETAVVKVAGQATVVEGPNGANLQYDFQFELIVHVPEPERWGGRALLKMVEITADRVLEKITAEFPEAVRIAAQRHEAVHAA